MKGVPFWQTAEFWTAVATILTIIVSHFLPPDWKDLFDQLVPSLIIIFVGLMARTTVVQAVQFARGNTYKTQGRLGGTWEKP